MHARIGRAWFTARILHGVISVLATAALLSGCGPEQRAADEKPTLPTGYWKAAITVPGGDIDTAFEIIREGETLRAQLINGQERVSIDEVSFTDGTLMLRFPGFNNHITAVLSGKILVGTLTLIKRHGKRQELPFRATPGSAADASDMDAAEIDMSGRWAVRFHEPDGSDTPSIGEFAQRGSRLFGTFLNPNGDHRFLAGHVRGNEFKLSTFDGAHAFLFRGEVVDDQIAMADFWSGDAWHQHWSGTRNPEIELPDAFSRTWLKPGYDRFDFEFPNADGEMVSLSDERFDGKVVVVTIAGTWCPNCNDEAQFMAPVYRQYRNRGLEVVALLFEHFEDPEIASEQIRNFRKKFGIEYETLLAGISEKEDASEKLPSLSAVLAWPTTIFIDRSGRVRNIHAGFSGPGTGEHYQELKKKMTDIITGLLDEPANLLESLTQEQSPN